MRAIVIILALVMGLLTPALAQQDDRGRLQAFLEDALSDAGRSVRIEGFAGALSARATVERLSIADDDGVWLTLEQVVLDWNRAALFRGSIEITELSAKTLRLPRLPGTADGTASPEASGFSLPELPVSIQIGALRIETAELGAPVLGVSADMSLDGSASLVAGEGAIDLTLDRIDGVRGSFVLAAGYANASGDLRVNLDLAEDQGGIAAQLLALPGRPSLAFKASGAGMLDDFLADVTLQTDGAERLGGQVILRANATARDASATRTLTVALSGDIRPLMDASQRVFFGPETTLSGDLVFLPGGALGFERLSLSTQAFQLTGNGELGADQWPRRFDIRARIVPPSTPRVAVPGSSVALGQAELTLQFDAAKNSQWSGRLVALDVLSDGNAIGRTIMTGAGTLIPGEGAIVGKVDGGLDLAVTGIDLVDAGLAAAVGSDLTGALQILYEENAPLLLRDVALDAGGISLNGRATAAGLLQGLDLEIGAALRVTAPRLQRFTGLAGRPLSGSAALRVEGIGKPLAGTFAVSASGSTRDLAIGIARLDPLLADAGTLTTSVRRTTSGVFVEQLQIATPHASIGLTGALRTGSTALDAQISITDAARVAAGLNGPANLAATVRQDGTAWAADMSATGPGDAVVGAKGDVTVDGRQVGSFGGALQLTASNLAPYSALVGRQIRGGADLTLAGNGNLQAQTFSATLDGTGRNLAFDLGEADKLFRGDARLGVTARSEEPGLIVFDRLDVVTPEMRADLTGSVGETRSRLRFDLGLRNLGLFAPDFPGRLDATGVVARGEGPWEVTTSATGPGGTTADVTGTVARDGGAGNLGIRGAAPLALANRFITPNLVSGRADFDLRLDGPLAVQSLSGRVATAGASLALADLPLGLRDLSGSATLANGRATLALTSQIRPRGTASLSGPVDLAAPYQGDLALTFNGVTVRQTGLLETSADGVLGIQGPLAGGARIAGRVMLGPVELRVAAASGGGALGLPGLRHVGEPAAVRQTRLRAGLVGQSGSASQSGSGAYPLDVTVEAPARIFVRGRGLDAELGGAVRLRGTTADIRPDGRFDLVRGRLELLGKRLVLSEGFASLQGSLDPVIRLVAETQADDVLVRILVEGLASAPEISVESVPELPQDEVFARLLFGRELSQISPFQALRIVSAINTLLGGQGLDVVGNLRENFGLDDLDVVQDEDGEVGVRAGKYISENVYSDVTTTTKGETEINLNLQISPSVTLRGSTGTDGNTGLGVFFQKDY